ncbi:MAG: T9SS type A sorting domain-containing protein [Ignavibacteriales bacterium]|nr:T9SS type A sorting domain-containing protein [Ignavibacteriales bacterium]
MICCVFACCILSTPLFAQYKIDAGFTFSTSILPKNIPGWPDSVGAEKVLTGFDINKNGKREFIAMADPVWYGDTSRPYLFWFEANGDNSYKLLWSAHLPGSNKEIYAYSDFTLADMDKDGKPEIVVATPVSPSNTMDIVYFYEFAGTTFPAQPTFSSRCGIRQGIQYRSSRVLLDDLDKDGDVEIVLTSRKDDYGGAPNSGAGRTLVVGHLNGDISPESFSSIDMEFADSSSVLRGGSVYDMGIADFDGDGKKEIWAFTWDLFSLAIYESQKKDDYTLQADINQARPDNDVGARHSMKFYDGDNDGKLEMYVAGITDVTNPGNLYCIDHTSDVSTLTTNSVKTITSDMPAISTWSFEGADIGDVDGNGKMDYIVTGPGPRRCVFRLEYKSGPVGDSVSYNFTTIFQDTLATDSLFNFKTIALGNDVDGDGKKEIFINNLRTRHGQSDPAIIIIESKTASASVRSHEGVTVDGYVLNQNYPNPFNPSTTIDFALPITQFVSLKVYDVTGRLVATLANQVLEAGGHSTVWNPSALASGTYILEMIAGNFSQRMKMEFLK